MTSREFIQFFFHFELRFINLKESSNLVNLGNEQMSLINN